MSEPKPPIVDTKNVAEVAPGIFIIGDHRTPLVPNIGIVLGAERALVVDTGMGVANGEAVLAVAKKLAGARPLVLTLTHFHPEHGFGAQAFKGAAHIFYNSAQRDDLKAKGDGYLQMFRTFGPAVAAALEGVSLVEPEEVYDGGSASLDLGNRAVIFRATGRAHTGGDQTIHVPDAGLVFVGDLAEERMFPIFPYFPPRDADIDAANWTRVLSTLIDGQPGIVVPGHGSVGGSEILAGVRDYMVDLGARVAERRRAAEDADAIVASLGPVVRAEHANWDAPEWIDFAIRYYAAQS
jgi:glyoxylase-like metal-dependent hydrolase (beta-lactamase superfamily II)